MVEVKYKEATYNTEITVTKTDSGKFYVEMERPATPEENGIWLEMSIPQHVAKIIAETLNSEQD